MILTVLGLYIYDKRVETDYFDCPNFVLYILLSYGIAAASVYLTGYLKIKNTFLSAGGALGVLVLYFLVIFQNYDKICVESPPETSKYSVTLTASDTTYADTEDFITVSVQDYKNRIGHVKFDGIGLSESKTDTTDLELESPIVNVEVLLTAKASGDVMRLNKIYIKGKNDSYTMDFRTLNGKKFRPGQSCQMPVINDEYGSIDPCDW